MNEKSDSRKAIWQVVQAINQTCKQGKGFETLVSYFHDQIVIMPPGLAVHAQGRDTCLKTYEDACSQMTFQRLDASQEHIDVYGSAAMVTYQYDCQWEFHGKVFDDKGHEVQLFVLENGQWQLAWRTVIPGSRQIEPCPTEADPSIPEEKGCGRSDVKTTCFKLMSDSPVCHLTTINHDGFPYTTTMNNLRCAREYPSLVDLHQESENAFVMYMSTSMQSGKMIRMQANPKVSVHVCDAGNFVDVTLVGNIEIITDQDMKNRVWQDGWTMYYPNGPEGPEYGVVKLVPSVVRGWHKDGPFEIKP